MVKIMIMGMVIILVMIMIKVMMMVITITTGLHRPGALVPQTRDSAEVCTPDLGTQKVQSQNETA